jgi:hypothetical protein
VPSNRFESSISSIYMRSVVSLHTPQKKRKGKKNRMIAFSTMAMDVSVEQYLQVTVFFNTLFQPSKPAKRNQEMPNELNIQ